VSTLFEINTDTYFDVGHDTDAIKRGMVSLWAAWERDDDIRVVPIDNPLKGHAVVFGHGYDFYGRIDHENQIISFTGMGGGYKEDYFKHILDMEYPNYRIVDL